MEKENSINLPKGPRNRSPNTIHWTENIPDHKNKNQSFVTNQVHLTTRIPKPILKNKSTNSNVTSKESHRSQNKIDFHGQGTSNQSFNHMPSLTSHSCTTSLSDRTESSSINTANFNSVNSRNFKIDNLLYSWFKEEKSKGNYVTSRNVKKKAQQLNIMLNGEPKFAASNGWLNRWKKRVRIDKLDEEIPLFNENKKLDIIRTSSPKSVDSNARHYVENKNFQNDRSILCIEPYYGGSHRQLIETIVQEFNEHCVLITLPAKKWHWRARCSALTLSQLIPEIPSYKVLFCSSVLNLVELLGLRPDLQKLKKVVYFHENQLVYPTREIKKRDFQFGYNQITTCLVADVIVFNSEFNLNSFLFNLESFLKIMPDGRPKDLIRKIEPKTRVIYFPIFLPVLEELQKNYDVLHIVWPHRWEFDKGPDDFFDILFRLKSGNVKFRVSVIGENFRDVPPVFDVARKVLRDEIVHWGFMENKDDYYNVLKQGHVVISTAQHEFYGVAMLEAVHHGCFPLVPNRLVYPEFYDKMCIYKNDKELFYRLKTYCYSPRLVQEDYKKLKLDVSNYSTQSLLPEFRKLLLLC